MQLRPSMNRQKIGVLGLLLIAVVFGPLGLLINRLAAQPGPIILRGGNARFGLAARAEGENSEAGEGVFLPMERDTLRQWDKARQLVAQGYYSDAVVLLDEILSREEDFFFKSAAAGPTEEQDRTAAERTAKENPRESGKALQRGEDSGATGNQATRSTSNRDARDKTTIRSLKLEAERLIGNLPPEGLQAYELQFGARARRMLADAVKSSDPAQLEQVARRFFHTKAGYEATLLLGRQHLDHGRPIVAGMCLQRLLNAPAAVAQFDPELSVLAAVCWWQAGAPDRASQVLVALKKKDPKGTVRLADHVARLFSDDQKASQWLVAQFGSPPQRADEQKESWPLFRGSPSRNASAPGGIPLLNSRWRVSTTTHPNVEKALVNLRQQYIDQGLAMLPAIHPLAVGDLVLMPTGKDLLAIDLNSGKRLWPVRSGNETPVDQWVQSTSGSGQPRSEPQATQLLAERFWLDATRGTLASDGRQVYLITETDRSVPQPVPVQGGWGGGRRRLMMMQAGDNQPRINKLTACELRTEGKLKWEVGGESGGEEPKLARAFFLGPPLPLQDRLYVLAETKGEIKLCVLDAATGHLEWSQQLAVVEANLQQDIFRRLAGCTPSFADGVLVCPTCAGAVVAVDIANRTLLWGYLYQRNHPMLGVYRQGMPMNGFGGEMLGNQSEHWDDSTVTIAEGCALITPPECNELHCVSLADGKALWSKPLERGDNLYVAGVSKGNVILVGKHALTAVRLADGKPAWKSKTTELKDAMPSGRGFLSGNEYFLPLTSAEVARVDLNSGQITARVKSHHGRIPGNLICVQDQVISEGVDYLDCFFQLEPLKARIALALAKDPNDAWALAHRGDIALDEGRMADALADIRRSYQSDADAFTRDLLVETLTSALASDFEKYRNTVPELEKLVQLDREKAAYLRVLGAGLQKSGEHLPALDAYLKLAKLENSDDLEDVDQSLAVARPRWIRTRISSLLRAAKTGQLAADVLTSAADTTHLVSIDQDAVESLRRQSNLECKKIDAAIQREFQEAGDEKSPKALKQFIAYFGDHPLADDARELLLANAGSSESPLVRESWLNRLESAADPKRRARAMAMHAALLRAAGQETEGQRYYEALQKQFGDEPIFNGLNVKQLIAAEGGALEGQPQSIWPEGEVKVDKGGMRVNRAQQSFQRASVEFRGPRDALFDTPSLEVDQQQLVARDSLGRELFRQPLVGDARTQNMLGNVNAMPCYAVADGHVLVACLGFQAFGIDLMKNSTSANRILWTQLLTDPASNPFAGMSFEGRAPNFWALRKSVVKLQNQPLGNVGPCTLAGVCIQRGREVQCLDPFTGKAQWVRKNVPPGCEIFGDADILVLIPPEGTSHEAILLRSSDGELLAKKTILENQETVGTGVGRYLLTSKPTILGSTVVRLKDPYTEREIWYARFSPGAKGAIIDANTAAVMEPDGKFTIMNLADGRKVVEQQLEPEKNLQNIYVLRSAQQDILITNHPFISDGPQTISGQVPPGTNETTCILVTGRIYAFDRATGQMQWPAPAAVEQQGLVLNQPDDLPVLTFLRTVISNGSQHGSALCLDKRNGRLLYGDDQMPQLITNYDISGDPKEKSVTVTAMPQSITLKFSDSPIAPEPPYQAGWFDKPKSTLARGKAGAFFRALRSIPLGEPADN